MLQYEHEEGVRVRTGTITEDYHYDDASGRTYERSVGTYNIANTTTSTVSEAWLLYDNEGGSLAGIGLRAE
jgi:hypothetical protein